MDRRQSNDIPSACYDDCNNAMIALERLGYSEKACNQENDPVEFLSGCVDCVSHHNANGGTEQLGNLFRSYLDYCLPVWNEDKRGPAISLAAELGYDIILVGPTGAITNEAPSATATATIPVSMVTIYVTETPSSSGRSSAVTTATSNHVATPDTHTGSRGWVAGAVIGPIAFVVLVVISWFLLRRRKRWRRGGEGGLSSSGHEELYAKPELHADGIKQVAPAELDGGDDSLTNPVELPGSHHDAASELPGRGRDEQVDGQTRSNANGSRVEENTEPDRAVKEHSSPLPPRDHTGDR